MVNGGWVCSGTTKKPSSLGVLRYISQEGENKDPSILVLEFLISYRTQLLQLLITHKAIPSGSTIKVEVDGRFTGTVTSTCPS